MSESKSITVFYDSPCIDGSASAWTFYKKYSADSNVTLNLQPLMHGRPDELIRNVLENVSPFDEVYFVDTSPSDEVLDSLLTPDAQGNAKVKSVTVWDHHLSEKSRLDKYKAPKTTNFNAPKLAIDVDLTMQAAALLCWKKLFGIKEKAPDLFKWIGKMEPPITLKTNREISIAAFIDSKKISSNELMIASINELVTLKSDDMVARGNSILADQYCNIDKLTANVTYTHLELLPNMGKMWSPLVNADVQYFGRTVSQALVNEGNKGTSCGVAFAWLLQKDGSVKMSIRTSGAPDAQEIARHLAKTVGVSGGGHKDSAVVQFSNLQQFVQNVPIFTKEQMRAEIWKAPQPKTTWVEKVSLQEEYPDLGLRKAN